MTSKIPGNPGNPENDDASIEKVVTSQTLAELDGHRRRCLHFRSNTESLPFHQYQIPTNFQAPSVTPRPLSTGWPSALALATQLDWRRTSLQGALVTVRVTVLQLRRFSMLPGCDGASSKSCAVADDAAENA